MTLNPETGPPSEPADQDKAEKPLQERIAENGTAYFNQLMETILLRAKDLPAGASARQIVAIMRTYQQQLAAGTYFDTAHYTYEGEDGTTKEERAKPVYLRLLEDQDRLNHFEELAEKAEDWESWLRFRERRERAEELIALLQATPEYQRMMEATKNLT